MECANCHFENTPGTSVCVRCGSALDLGGIDVHPPRMSGGVRGWLGRRHTARRVLRRARRLAAPSRLRWAWWCLVPGTGQIARGPRWRGWVLLVVWLATVLGTVGLAGTREGGYCYGVVLAAHTVSLAMLFRPRLERRRLSWIQRAAVGLGAFLVLHYAVYGSLRYVATGVAVPLELVQVGENPLIQNGDVVLYEGHFVRGREYRRGDLVMYRVRRHIGEGVYTRGGQNLDRIVGLPGDTVVIRDGQMWVNRQVTELAPLGGLGACPMDLQVRAREDEYIIIPSLMGYHQTLNPTAAREASAVYGRVTHVKRRDVLGKVTWRIRPFSRFGRLE